MKYEFYTLDSAEGYVDELQIFVRWLEPVLLLLVAPLAIFAERVPVITALIGLVLLLIPYLLRKAVYGYFTVSIPAILPLAALLFGILPLSIWMTPAPERAMWPELMRSLWSMAVCLGVIHWSFPAEPTVQWTKPDPIDERGRLPRTLLELTLLYLVIGALFTLSSLLILRSADKLTLLTVWAAYLPRVYSQWFYGFHNNEIGGIVLLFLPLTTALLLGANMVDQQGRYGWLWRGCWQSILFLLVLLFGAALLLAQSRAAWLGAAMAFVLLLVLLDRRGWLLLLILAGVLGIALTVIGPLRVVDGLTVGSDVKTANDLVTGILTDRNLAARFLIWQRALHGIADAPLTGMGLAAFRLVVREPYAPLAGYHIDPDIHHAHNLFLQIGVDLGLPGLFAFGLLLLLAITALVRCYRQTPEDSPMRAWTAGLAGSLLAYLIYSMFDTVTLGAQRGVTFWFLLGLCLAAGELRVNKAATEVRPPQFQPAGFIPQPQGQPAYFLPITDEVVTDKRPQSGEYQDCTFLVQQRPPE
ncbi:MAG: O-antigen ligase family protein [Caldilineaceae bacterium]